MSETISVAGEQSYERDFYAWTQAQAAALRAAARSGANLPVDWENVAEEIESLGKSDARELRSRIATIIEHLLKLEFAPADLPRVGWQETVERSRAAFERSVEDSPSLRRRIPEWIEYEHAGAVRLVLLNLKTHGEATTELELRLGVRRYSTEEVLGNWFPPA